MSNNQIDLLRSKASEIKSNLNAVVTIHNEIKNDKSLNDIEEQIRAINNSINTLENKNHSVPQQFREIKTELVTKLSFKDEATKIVNELFQALQNVLDNNSLHPIKTKVSNYISHRTNTSNIPDTLTEIIDVTKLVWKNKLDFSLAVTSVARKRNIANSTIRDKCTRRIGLKTEDFRELLDNKEKMLNFLLKTFPSFSSYIKQELS